MATWDDINSLFQSRSVFGEYVEDIIRHLVGSQLFPAWNIPLRAIADASNQLVNNIASILAGAVFVKNAGTTPDDTVSEFVDPAQIWDVTSLVGDIGVRSYTATVQSQDVDQLAMELASQRLGILKAFREQCFLPQQANGFLGFPDLVVPGQVVTSLLGTFNLELMDTLQQLVTEGNGAIRDTAYFMNSAAEKAYIQQVRASGQRLQYVIDRFGTKCLAYDFKPIYRCDYIPNNEPPGGNMTSVYCAVLDYENNGVYSIEGDMRIQFAQRQEAEDADLWRGSLPCGLGVAKPASIARATGLIVT